MPSQIAVTESKDFPLVTVITVVFNGLHLLREAHSSVAHQSYPNLQYVVIDGWKSDVLIIHQKLKSKFQRQWVLTYYSPAQDSQVAAEIIASIWREGPTGFVLTDQDRSRYREARKAFAAGYQNIIQELKSVAVQA